MSYFGVGGNVGNFRTTKHEYRLNFEYGTDVKRIKSSNIPRFGFSFIPIVEILRKDYDPSYLVGNDLLI